MTGIQAFVELLSGAGVRYVFGNPGTTELPLNDLLVDDRRIEYILGLQEVPVMSMADGYAMASGSLGVVNLHACCGLGNAMGMLYNAHREGTPLLVTAGQQDRRLKFEEPILGGDMVAVARPWTKWAAEVERVEDLASAVRRAMHMALTPPTGPVFLSIPLDVQTTVGQFDLTPIKRLDTRVRPPLGALLKAAEVLLSAKNPAILVGSRVVERGAVAELVAVAERLGATVMSEPGHTNGRLSFPADHPLYGQTLPHWSPEIRQRLADYDVLLVVGMDLLRQYVYHEPSRPIPESTRLIHFEENPYQIGKNYPVEVGVLGDSKMALAELEPMLAGRMTPGDADQVRRRTALTAERHRQARTALEAKIDSERALRPMTPATLMGSLARVLPPDVALVEEAVTTTGTQLHRLGALRNTTGYFAHRGWALGWGLGCAIGVKLAWPDRPVLALLGDGAALYGIQGLWSAAHYRLPVTFVVCNNGQYQILKAGARSLGLPAAAEGRFLGMDLAAPAVDMVNLARSLGVAAERITEPAELATRVAESLRGDVPQLFDVTIQPSLAGSGG
jgi:benzoylformate decarboxylase